MGVVLLPKEISTEITEMAENAHCKIYLLVKTIEPVNYAIQKSVRSKIIVVHVDKLKKCVSEIPESWLGNKIVQQGVVSQERSQFNETNDTERVVVRENAKYLNNDDSQMNEVIERPQRVNRRKPGRFNDYLLNH